MSDAIVTEKPAKVWTKDSVIDLLDRNDKAVVSAIKGLYARQTEGEKASRNAVVLNGRGFNSKDAPFLSDIAKKLPRYNDNMTIRQKAASRKMLRKYWRQLLEMIEEKGGVVSYKAPKRKDAENTLDAPVGNMSFADLAQSGNLGM